MHCCASRLPHGMHVRIIGLEAIHISREEEQAPPLKHKSPANSQMYIFQIDTSHFNLRLFEQIVM
jgi:hypothetical protein